MSTPDCIPYSRSAASLPRANRAPRKHLFHKLSSLSLFDKKPTAETWHKQIDETANSLRPVSSHNDAFFLFPWAQLRLHTDEFLRKQKIPAVEYDVVLTGLITSHTDKVVALAACAHALSETAIVEVLKAFSNRDDGLEDYLQAFVAAGHGKPHDFAADDAAWAATLVTVHKAATSSYFTHEALHALYLQSSKTQVPVNTTLLSRLPGIVGPLLQKLKATLDGCRKEQDWTSALLVQEVLANIDEATNGKAAFVEELLQSEIPTWRHWASWRPNKARLQAWQPKSKDWLRPLWELLGPNFDFVDGVHVSALSRLILDHRLITWLEQNGVTIGPGLLVNDTQDAQTAFAARLFSTVDFICAEGGLAETFFLHLWLDDRLGLDGHTLDLWDLARQSLLKQAPMFLQGVLQGGPDRGDPTSTLSIGLCAVDNTAYKGLRIYLERDIRHYIGEAYSSLKSSFLTELQAENDWFLTASALVQVRSTLARFSWLGDMASEALHLSSESLMTMTGLAALQELHQALTWPDDLLEPPTRAYIGNVVLGQPCGKDDGVAIIKELHLLWQQSNYRSHRCAALTLAHMADVSASCRAQCLHDIITFNITQVKKLEDAIMGLKYKPAAMCHCIVRLGAKAVNRNPAHKASWAAVTRHVLETYNISPRYAVSDRVMTACSFKKYQKWVQNLFCIFGDLAEDAKESMVWLGTLSDYRDVLVKLQGISEAQRALHCIATSYGSVFSSHVVDMLQSIQAQTAEDRMQLMVHVVFSLTEKSLAKQVAETVCLLSSISAAGFRQCKELVMVSDRESLYIAAVQMEVWLQSESIGEDVKKALRYALWTGSSEVLLTLFRCLGKALHLPSSPQPATAREYFQKRFEAMMKSAHELESMRIYLKGVDQVGVATVLTNLGLEDSTSFLEEEVLDLPNELFNFVEQVDDTTVELQFPLTGVKELQRNAMGLKSNESLVVRLNTDVNGTRESYCVHVIDTDTNWPSVQHDPVKVWQSNPPSRQYCKQNRATRVAYMIMRCGWQKLRSVPRASLAEIYQGIEVALKTYGNKCLVCHRDIGANLYRPTLCSKAACRSTYLSSELDIRIADLRLNPRSVSLLLAAIQAAALTMSSRGNEIGTDLLPDRPDRLSDNKKLIVMLDSAFAIANIVRAGDDVNAIRQRHSIRHELFFSWALNVYQGFIVEATGSLRIPNLPNVLQFAVVDSRPEISAAFAKHDTVTPRQVLFHGKIRKAIHRLCCSRHLLTFHQAHLWIDYLPSSARASRS